MGAAMFTPKLFFYRKMSHSVVLKGSISGLGRHVRIFFSCSFYSLMILNIDLLFQMITDCWYYWNIYIYTDENVVMKQTNIYIFILYIK